MKATVYGLVSNDLDVDTLENLCVSEGIQTGPFGSQLHQKDYLPVGTPIITVEHLGENRVLHQDLPRVSGADKERLSRYVMQKGDIIFSRVGSVDRRALVRDEEDGWLFSGRCLRVRPNNTKIDSDYLSWFFGLGIFKDYIRRIAVGATMPSLNTQLLSNVPVIFPSLPEQQAIAGILGALDDKIELNRRMNRTLESMARAVFKSWFVDFTPVREKAEGAQPKGMDAETARLFPSKFVDSELGEIPLGWSVQEIKELTSNIQYGLTQSASTEKVGPHFLRITDIQGGQVNWNDVPYCMVSSEDHEKYKLLPGDIVVARTGASTGENLYIVDAPDAVFASYLVRFQFQERALARIVGVFMRTNDYFSYVANNLGGSAQPNANAQVLSGATLAVPTLEIAKKYLEFIEPLDRMIYANNKESRTLASVRDSLLPKLMRGEVRVSAL